MLDSMTIRPIGDDDDLDELHHGDGDWVDSALTRRVFVSAGEAVLAFHVAEDGGHLVGYVHGMLEDRDNPTHAGFGVVWVRPEARGRGIGTALWEYLLAVATERGARRLTARIDSADEASLRWLTSIGAITGGIHLESRLELGDDLPLLPPPEGVTVDTVPVDADDSIWRAAHEAHVRLGADTPDAETNPTPIPFPAYRAILAHPWQLCLATTDDGAIVGLTCVLVKSEKEHSVNTMLTAVNREWRGQGLATALKTAHARTLRDAGWRTIVTQNMEGNDHILAANTRLGFQQSAALFDAIYDFPDLTRGEG